MCQKSIKRPLNDSSSQPKQNLKRLRLIDGKRLMHSKTKKKLVPQELFLR